MKEEIVYAAITLIGVVVTALITRSTFLHELDKRTSIIETKLDRNAEDIKEHNHYAKLFAESMPVVQEQIKVINHRIDDLEKAARQSINN